MSAVTTRSTRVKQSDGTDLFERLEDNKTVLHLLCSLNRADELRSVLQRVTREDAALALAQVRPLLDCEALMRWTPRGRVGAKCAARTLGRCHMQRRTTCCRPPN